MPGLPFQETPAEAFDLRVATLLEMHQDHALLQLGIGRIQLQHALAFRSRFRKALMPLQPFHPLPTEASLGRFPRGCGLACRGFGALVRGASS